MRYNSDNHGYFLRSGSLAAYAQSTRDGIGVVGASETLLLELEKRCGRDAASLFARPYLMEARGGGASSVSWYTDIDGTAVRWIDLDPQSREQSKEDIRSAVAALEPALHDPSLGPDVQRALNVADLPYDLLIVGGKPVLTNWGLLPIEIATDETARRAHWEQGLGAILRHRDPPPFLDADPHMQPEEYSPIGTGIDNTPSRDIGIAPAAAMHSSRSGMVGSRRTGRTIPGWVWPAAACGLVFFAILVLLFGSRFALLPLPYGTAGFGTQSEAAVLQQRAAALRASLSDPCAGPAAR